MRGLRLTLAAGATTAALALANGVWGQGAQPTAPPLAAPEPAPLETATPPEPATAPTISDAIAGGRLLFEARGRYEFVDQKRTATLTDNGESFTLRTRLGWETAEWNHLRGLVEFEDVRSSGRSTSRSMFRELRPRH